MLNGAESLAALPRMARERKEAEMIAAVGQQSGLEEVLSMAEPDRTRLLSALATTTGQTYWLAPIDGSVTLHIGAPHERHHRAVVLDGPTPFTLREAVYLLDLHGPRSEKPVLEELLRRDISVQRGGKKKRGGKEA